MIDTCLQSIRTTHIFLDKRPYSRLCFKWYTAYNGQNIYMSRRDSATTRSVKRHHVTLSSDSPCFKRPELPKLAAAIPSSRSSALPPPRDARTWLSLGAFRDDRLWVLVVFLFSGNGGVDGSGIRAFFGSSRPRSEDEEAICET